MRIPLLMVPVGVLVCSLVHASALAQPRPCTLSVESIEAAVQAPSTLPVVSVTGTADDCTAVEVQLSCSGEPRVKRDEVTNGVWDVDYTAEDAKLSECVCGSLARVTVKCVDGVGQCGAEGKERLECDKTRPAFQYAAKFVCGRSEGVMFGKGDYRTTINVHNPTDHEVHYRKRSAVALMWQESGEKNPFRTKSLGPNDAFAVECREIAKLSRRDADLVDGFLVIESPVELDVVVVYTATGPDGQLASVDVERVPVRKK